MVLIKEDVNKATHWLGKTPWFGRITVPLDVAMPCLMALPCTCGPLTQGECRCHLIDGVEINSLSEQGPWQPFKRRLIKAAREFVERMRQQSLQFELVTPEARMLIYGPYHTRTTDWVSDHGRVFGRQGADDIKNPDSVDFKIFGEFTQKYARVTDPGPGRAEWALKFWADQDKEAEKRARARKRELAQQHKAATKHGLVIATR